MSDKPPEDGINGNASPGREVSVALTEKERLLHALSGRKCDRPPVICPGGMMTMASAEVMEKTGNSWPSAHIQPDKMAGLALAMHDLTGLENLGVPFCMTVEAEAFGCQVDYGKINREPRIARSALEDTEGIASLRAIDPGRSGRMPVILDAIHLLREQSHDTPIIGNLVGPVSLAASIFDAMIFLRLLRKKPADVHRLLDFLAHNLIEFGRAQVRSGADIIAIADPTATGEILGPSLFGEFAAPHIRNVADAFRREGIPVIIHICGNLKTVEKELSSLQADCLSVDSVVSIRKLRESLDTVIMGNVSTFLLEKGPADRIHQTARSLIADGVDILAPACGLSPGTSVAHIRALTGAAGR